jgi:hypothetical protein
MIAEGKLLGPSQGASLVVLVRERVQLIQRSWTPKRHVREMDAQELLRNFRDWRIVAWYACSFEGAYS